MLSDFLIETIDLQPRYIYSMTRIMGVREFSQTCSDLFLRLKENRFRQAGPLLSIFHEEDFNTNCMDIELGVEVTEATGENIRLLAPGLCCFMTYVGRYDDFNLCFAALMEWIFHGGYSISGPPIIIYIKGYTDCDNPEEFVTEIYVPIKG